jgi:hypothetical protein
LLEAEFKYRLLSINKQATGLRLRMKTQKCVFFEAQSVQHRVSLAGHCLKTGYGFVNEREVF